MCTSRDWNAQGDVADFGAAANNLAELESLDVSYNPSLTGNMAGLCKAAAKLTYLDLSTTDINGSIPDCLLGQGNFHLYNLLALRKR